LPNNLLIWKSIPVNGTFEKDVCSVVYSFNSVL
jgi:hypothetical protein